MFDIGVIVITIGLSIYGFFEGLIRGAIKLIGFIATMIVLALFSDQISNFAISIKFLPQGIAISLAFVLAFIISTTIITLLAGLIHKLIHLTPIGIVDSGLGVFFGAIKGLLLSALIATTLSFTPQGSYFKKMFLESETAQPLVILLSKTIPIIKNSIPTFYQRYIPSSPPAHEEKQDDRTPSQDFI